MHLADNAPERMPFGWSVGFRQSGGTAQLEPSELEGS